MTTGDGYLEWQSDDNATDITTEIESDTFDESNPSTSTASSSDPDYDDRTKDPGTDDASSDPTSTDDLQSDLMTDDSGDDLTMKKYVRRS
jgi:hypothetical protein